MRFGCTSEGFESPDALFNNRHLFQAAALAGFEKIDDRRKHVRCGILRPYAVIASNDEKQGVKMRKMRKRRVGRENAHIR